MSLANRLQAYVTRVAEEFRAIRTLIGGSGTADASSLTTTASNLVGAINEVKVTADSAAAGGASINDGATSTSTVWSSQQIDSQVTTRIATAIDNLVDGAPGALDTLNELAAAINDDAGFHSAVTSALGNRIRCDAAQSFDAARKLQACQNIGVGDPDADLVATLEAALAA